MPYSSGIQLINDANGTTYGFLADNGAIWQCQWNAEAQRWEQGQVIPQAFGGTALQVLYLDDLWPIEARQGNTANPGLVLAYRLGDSSQAEIYASFGAWDSDGELSWSAPVALTDDDAEDQKFSLVPGESGLFNLVVQKQVPGDSLDEKIEQQDILSIGERDEERLQQLAIGSRQDQDLYVSSFKLQNNSVGIQLLQRGEPQANGGGSWPLVAMLEAAEQSTDPVTSPQQAAFAAPTELQRSLLLPKPAPELGATLDTDSSNTGENENAKRFNLGGNFFRIGKAGVAGSLSAGVGLFPTRWLITTYNSQEEPERVESGHDSGYEPSFIASDASLDSLEEEVNQDANLFEGDVANSDRGGLLFRNSSEQELSWKYGRVDKGGGGFVLLFSGLFGGINQGSRSSAAINTAKVEFLWPKKGSVNLANSASSQTAVFGSTDQTNSIAIKFPDGSFQSIAGGGGLRMLFSYGVGFRNEFDLKSYTTAESITLGKLYHTSESSTQGATITTKSWNFGLEAEQYYSSDKAPLPEWLSYLGRSIVIESEIANAIGVARGRSLDKALTEKLETPSSAAFTVNPATVNLVPSSIKDPRKIPQNVFGFLNGIIVPAITETVLVSETSSDDKPNKSYGVTGALYGVYEKLRPKGYGYRAVAADQLTYFFAGDATGNFQNITYASAGAAFKYGIYIPLLSYYRKNAWNVLNSSSEEPQSNGDLGTSGSSTVSDSQDQFSSTGSYYNASSGTAYPLVYNPDSPSSARILSSTGTQNADILGGFVSNLYQFNLNETSEAAAFQIRYGGSGLTPTTEPVEVSILGPALDSQDISNRAKALVTISKLGEIDSIAISQGGSYLYLPETGDGTGEYILPLDLVSAGLITPNGNPPIISVNGSQADTLNSPLKLTPIQRILAQYYSVGSSTIEENILNYPQLDQDGKAIPLNSSNDNTYYYTGVPLVASIVDSDSSITLFNKAPTARVSISNGKVIGIEPDQDLIFEAIDINNKGYKITADIRAYGHQINNDELKALPPISVTLAAAESFAYNNVVSETEFTRQIGGNNSGVYIADGIEDTIPLFPEYGSRPIASRVVWVNTSYDEATQSINTTRWYLNATNSSGKGVTVQPNYINEVSSLSDLPTFSAAISPAAVTIEGPSQSSQSGYAGDTLVAWVEATDPVVPITNADGEQSFQDFMEALYGNQRINYRINRTTSSSGWTALDETDLDQLYQPDGAMITELRAFNVDNTTFLAWTEIPLADGSQPAAIKVAQINSEAASFQWNALTTDSSGNSTISTIPWDGSRPAAVMINDISMASVTSTGADGLLIEKPILSFSRDVRTPYLQSVLNDDPELYLQFGDLSAGTNAINIAEGASETTLTYVSDSGIDFSIASALPKSQTTAVANTNGTGVLISQLGTNNAAIRNLLNQVPVDDLPPMDGGVIAEFSGSIAIDGVLTVTAVSSGTVSLGSVLTGVGVNPATTITEVLTPFVAATDSTPATAGTYKVSEGQTLASTSFKAYPEPTNYAYNSLTLYIDGTTLTTADNASVVLNTGDRIGGLGIKRGTTITAVNRNSEGAVLSYSVDVEQTVGSSESPLTAVAAPGGSSAPYTIEFWTQTIPESNPSGAGLVAYGQPSDAAIGEAALPVGWLLESSFVVDRITYQQAAARGETSASEAISNGTNGADLYAWGWAVIANGANTTTLQGNGGSNLYSNAVELNNLRAGVKLSGVTAFLNANGVPPSELEGVGGTPADVISRLPQTQLQFAHFIDEETSSPSFGRATSNLNTIAIDTSSATMNEGVLLAADASDNSTITDNINNLFESLWQFQNKTGEAKVTFSLAANPENPATSSSTPLSIDQFAGYELGFSLSSGPAVSINQNDELVFDVASGVSLLGPSLVRFVLLNNLAENYGQGNNSLVAALWKNPRAELSDIADLIVQADSSGKLMASDILNELQIQELSILAEHQTSPPWFYVAASYLPEYRDFVTADGTVVQIPSNSGTASIYINGQLVAQSETSAPVIDAYDLENGNDQLLILPNHNKGAIDQLAIYNEALSASTAPAIPSGWDVPSTDDALIILREEAGLLIDSKTPDRGAIPGAVTAHWDARNVNPNDAELSTFYSVFTPAGPGELTGSWSSPTTINPVLAPVPTVPSARSDLSSLQDNWLLALPTSDWANSTWSVSPSPTSSTPLTGFNPSGRQLQSIQVNLDPTSPAITLHPDQVMLGDDTLSDLQPLSSEDDLKYTILNNAPAFTLLIDRNDAQHHDQASITFNFSDGTTATSAQLEFNNIAQEQANLKGVPADLTAVQQSNKALATAAVIEQAPLQLKYVDSGEVFRSASSASSSDQNAASTPAESFGTSQVAGSFEGSSEGTYSGWLAIAQPRSADAVSDPGGRVWIQYTGDFTRNANGTRTAVADPATAPITWLNALADSNFSPNEPNRPLLTSARYQSNTGGLLILADATVGWGDGFGEVMVTADLNNDGIEDLVIAAPQANGGGRVYIINGTWIKNNLTTDNGATTLNLANPDEYGDYVIVLTPSAVENSTTDDAGLSDFGSALAFDQTNKRLLIGAPNYLRQLNTEDQESLTGIQPIGALYQFDTNDLNWSSAAPRSLTPWQTGQGGTSTVVGTNGSPTTSYWGSMFGSAIAVSNDGGLAVSAPGFSAGLLYSGTQAARETYGPESKRNPSSPFGDGALIGVQLPTQPAPNQLPGFDVSKGTNSRFTAITTGDRPTDAQSTYMQNLKALQTDNIVEATIYNNQAAQSEAVGAVYLYTNGSSDAAATIYGPQPWNVLGTSGFGSSLAFIDLANQNIENQLAIGANAAGGSGAVYVIDKKAIDQKVTDQSGSLGDNQYLAHAIASLTLYGAESQDFFGGEVVNLGDINNDQYDDLLIQAMNAASTAGAGYVLFGSDQFDEKLKNNPAVGSVSSGSIGQFKQADGSSLTTSILQELGFGQGFTGSGTFGNGDINADGINDIQLGSGPNGSAYLTWGHPYLEAINNLALNKLASNTGYMLDGLATTTAGSLRSIGDFNGDGYGDFITIQPGELVNNVRIELGANTQEILADYLYNHYNFTVSPDTQVLPAGDINGDGLADIALFLNDNLSSTADGNQGTGSTTGILYGRNSDSLPIGSGFGFLSPVDPDSNAPLTSLPGQQISGGLSNASPSVIGVGNTLYAAVKGTGDDDTSILFAQSSDGGSTWSDWANLSTQEPGFATNTAPALGFYEQTLYLGFTDTSGALQLSSFDPASTTLTNWSTPATIASTQPEALGFRSTVSPAFLNQGDALAVLWLDSSDTANPNTLYSAVSTTPDTTQTVVTAPSPWSGVDGGSSPASPALAQLVDTLYMAVQGNGDTSIYWSSSNDGGTSWADWQALPSGMTSEKAPSLAAFDGTLYLSYLGDSNNEINITRLSDAATNTWTSQYQIPWSGGTQSAEQASLVTETINGSEQLAVYYTATNGTSALLRTASSHPARSSSWSDQISVDYNNGAANQTASGPLAVTSNNGQTVISYQGGTADSPSNEIYLATSSSPADSSSWLTQAYTDPGQRTGLGLINVGDQLLLSYSTNASADALQLQTLSLNGSNWEASKTDTTALISSGSNLVSILQTNSNSSSGLLLAGIDSSSNAIEVSLAETSTAHDSWTAPKQLLERTVAADGSVNFTPVTATAAPVATLLGTDPVVALNNNGAINVYIPSASGSSLTLASSFSDTDIEPAISPTTAAGITTTDTGLALTYTNTDQSVALQRLDFFSLDGSTADGVNLSADGFVSTDTDLLWQSSRIDSIHGGISTNQASVPVVVDGNLMLTSIAANSDAVQINVIPALHEPDSSSWINSTIQLPDGKGGWMISQTDASAPSTLTAVGDLDGDGNDDLVITNPGLTVSAVSIPDAWSGVDGGSSPATPALAQVGDTLYMAVQGNGDNLIYWSSSSDGGTSWTDWQALPSGMTSNNPPSLATFDGSLYLSYLGDGNNEINITRLSDAATNTWTSQYQIPWSGGTQSADQASLVSETINGSEQLAVYYTATNGTSDLLRTASSDPASSSSWSDPISVDYNNDAATQTASGPLAVTSKNGQTVIAYQGGTVSNPSNEIYLATSSSPANSSSWSAQAYTDPGQRTGLGLTNVGDDLLLSYSTNASADALQLHTLSLNGSNWQASKTDTTALISSSSNLVSILQTNSNSSFGLLLAGINSSNGNAVEVQTASTTTSMPGARLISGAASAGDFVALNDATNSVQAVQLAPALTGTTAVNTISATLTGSGSLSLSALSGDDAYSVSGSFTDPDPWLASANAADPIASAQQLFSNAFAEADGWTSTSAGPLTGDPALNTTTSFGDLNGDGYEDYFDASSSLWIASAPQAPVFSLWSLRAAGDVNGNGVDDILLALTPQGPSYQAQSDGKPAAIYSALIDGALFNVDQTSNTFNLSDLKAALNPYNSIELYDVTTSSYSDEYQSLQNWFSPILKYQAPIDIDSVDNLIATSPAPTLDVQSPTYYSDLLPDIYTSNSPAPTITRDDQGNLYTITTLVDGYSDSIALSNFMYLGIGQNSLDPNSVTYKPIDLSKISSLTSGTFPSYSIAPLTPGAAIHNGKLFVAIPSSNNTSEGYGRATNDIWIAYADLGDPESLYNEKNWTSYLLSSDQNTNSEYTLLTPTLVSEGERLAIYFPAGDEGNNDENLNIHYLYSNDPTSPEAWGSTLGEDNAYTDSSSTISIDASLSTTPPNEGWASSGGVIVTSPIAATTYQGRTVLAFRGYSDGTGDNVANGGLLLAFAPTAHGASANNTSASTDWTLWDTTTTGINTPSITTDQANLYLTYTPWSTSSTDAYFFPVALNIDHLSPDQPVDLSSSSLIKAGTTHTLPITLQQAGDNRVGGLSTDAVNIGMTSSTYAGGYFLNADTQANNIGNAPQSVTPSIDGNTLYVTNQVNGTYSGTMSAAVSIDYITDLPPFWDNQISKDGHSLAGYSIDGNIDVNGDGFTDILLSDPSDPSLAVDNQYVLFGGDYLDIASQVGTNGDDTLIGTPLADVIYTIAGDDTVISNGGADVIYAGAGADTIAITGNDFFRIDAGSGIDKLVLQGDANQSYDFRLDVGSPDYFAGTKLQNIELISSYDYGSNTLSFDPKAISAFNNDRMLFLTPDSTDFIDLYSDSSYSFSRDIDFDTEFGGVVWNAYGASPVGSSGTADNPTLVYVLNPEPGDDDWLSNHVITTASAASSSPALLGSPALTFVSMQEASSDQAALSSAESPTPPTTSPISYAVDFGEGLTLTAYKANSTDTHARFVLSRSNTDQPQVVAYASSSANSTADPGSHYTAVAGLIRLEPGQSSQTITVPLKSSAIQKLRSSQLSLQVEEIADLNQQPIHLLINPADASSDGSKLAPVLSSFQLEPSQTDNSAQLTFRADVNAGTSNLKLSISQRNQADSATPSQTKDLLIADFSPSDQVKPILDPITGAYRLDTQHTSNGQISTRFQLNFDSTTNQPVLALLGADNPTLSSFALSSDSEFSIAADQPLIAWRSDANAGEIDFALVSPTADRIDLLDQAAPSQAGSLNPSNLNDWITTEGKAIGANSSFRSLPVAGHNWTPVASLKGVELSLEHLSIDGSTLTATFAGGIKVHLNTESTPTTPSTLPLQPDIIVNRLGAYKNEFGFYRTDDLTGSIGELTPGDAGYLQAALARSQEEGLFLTSQQLPAYSKTATFSDLSFDRNHNYGVVLAVNGNREKLFSSYSAANPNNAVQMVHLDSIGNPGYTIIGVEDLDYNPNNPTTSDYNDFIIEIAGNNHITIF